MQIKIQIFNIIYEYIVHDINQKSEHKSRNVAVCGKTESAPVKKHCS